MKRLDKYVLGDKIQPEWFREACRIGKIKFMENDDGELEATIYSGMSSYKAKEGDVIVKTINGLAVKKKAVEVKRDEKEVNDIS